VLDGKKTECSVFCRVRVFAPFFAARIQNGSLRSAGASRSRKNSSWLQQAPASSGLGDDCRYAVIRGMEERKKKTKNEKTAPKRTIVTVFSCLFFLLFFLSIFLSFLEEPIKERTKKMEQTEKINKIIEKVLENEIKYFDLRSDEKCKIFNKGSKEDKYVYNYKDMNEYLKDILNIK
jgi:hypothetical protein